MLIAQITDLHLGFDPNAPEAVDCRLLRQVIEHLLAGPNGFDALLVTGDLADRGAAASYVRVRETLAEVQVPVYFAMGNHDDRASFSAVFPEAMFADGFVQYCVALPEFRLVVLDTLEVGRHGGGFCEVRATWLAARLAEAPDTPTVIVMHHPPFPAGIAWMDPAPDEPWIRRFEAAIAAHSQVRAIWCGHLHRPITTNWRGIPVSICPSVSPELTLDLRPIDPELPDGRSMVAAGMPGAAIHRWTGSSFVTLFDNCGPHDVLARFDRTMQPLVRHLHHERRSSP